MAYITPSGIPSKQANTIQVMKMCEAFSQQGHDVVLICPTQSIKQISDVFDYYGVENVFEIRRLPWQPLRGYQFTILAALSAYRSDADLVYGRSIAGCYFSALLGLDVVYESHVPADDIHPITNQMFKNLMKSGNLRYLVVISEALKNYYQSRYDVEGQVHVAPDAAPRQYGTPIKEIHHADGQQVGYVGHLYEGKGIQMIIDIAREVSNSTFHLVGGTDEDLVKWRSKARDVPNITFHGFVEPNRVPDHLASFDAVVAPYQNQVRGAGGNTNLSKWMSPLKIFEYMAAEKPIVCSDLPVLREVLTDGQNALLRPPDDVTAWVEAIKQLQTDEELRKHIIRNAKKEFERHYSYEARAQNILNTITPANASGVADHPVE